MNQKFEIESTSCASSVKSGDFKSYSNDEDLQFRDITLSGSMSRSLKALNSYVKKNIFFDESEEQHDRNDSAYFTKENSPNVSISKSDSESLRSNDKRDENYHLTYSIVTGHQEHSDEINPEISDHVTLTDDYKFNKLLKSSSTNRIPEIHIEAYEEDAKIDQTKELPTTNECENVNKNKIPEKRSDHKIATNNIINKSTFQFSDDTNRDLHPSRDRTSSLTNINKSNDSKLENKFKPTAALRKKPVNNHSHLQEHRHTIHDVSEWVNRTEIYPDVYAPLPYSK